MPSKIQLTRGYEALVDDADYELVIAAGPWHANVKPNAVYAVNSAGKKLHRFLTGITEPSIDVDHKNHNTLDNRRANLRVATKSQNHANTRKLPGTSSRFKGVYFYKRTGKWRAKIRVRGKHISLGYFNSEIDAALAYYEAAREHFGEFHTSAVIRRADTVND
jgi:hypothetical protein